MQLSDILIPLSSLFAIILPGVLKNDAWAETKPWLNGIISGLVVAVFAALTVAAGGQFTGNLAADWALFAGAYGALLAGPFQPLDQWIQSALHLPFLKPAPANANPVRVPTALVMPSSPPAQNKEQGK